MHAFYRLSKLGDRGGKIYHTMKSSDKLIILLYEYFMWKQSKKSEPEFRDVELDIMHYDTRSQINGSCYKSIYCVIVRMYNVSLV